MESFVKKKMNRHNKDNKNNSQSDTLDEKQKEKFFLYSSSSSSSDETDFDSSAHLSTSKNNKCKSIDSNTFIHHFIDLFDPESILFDNQSLSMLNSLINHLEYLFKNENAKDKSQLNLLCNSELVKIFISIFKYSLDELSVLDENLSEEKFRNVYFLMQLCELICCLTNFSVSFRQLFHSNDGTKIFLRYLGESKAICLKTQFYSSLNEDFLIIHSFMRSIIGTLHNLSKTISFGSELNASKVLLSFAHQIKSECSYLMLIYMTLANILNDQEISELNDTFEIVKELVSMISLSADLISDQVNLIPRMEIHLEFGRCGNVCIITDINGFKWDFVELINGLYRISVNDKIKFYIYASCDIHMHLNKIIQNGNHIEKEYSLRLLYQLSFDKKVANLIGTDNVFISYLNDLINQYENDLKYFKFVEYCRGLLWRIKQKDEKNTKSSIIKSNSSAATAISDTNNNESKLNSKFKIMISYNKFCRDLCMKIKETLEELGYEIWIDVENIHGSSLEAMASAIENSDVVLICMTEKYKLSTNCRTEAEYIFNIQKRYIPLIMESNYKPDGWLGLILGTKIYIDFTKYSFDVSIQKLLKEIQIPLNLYEKKEGNKSKTGSKEPIFTNENKIIHWKNEEVLNWLQELKLNEGFYNELKGFNGEMLYELNLIRQKAPEYFYSSLSKASDGLKLGEVVNFSKHLRKLFE